MTGILTNVYIDVWLKKYTAAIKAITRTLLSSEAVPRLSSCCLQTLPILTHSNEAQHHYNKQQGNWRAI